MIEYHPYDASTDIEGINDTNIQLITAQIADKETFSFVWMGDTQRFYDDTEDMVAYINQHLDVDFVMHGGDISDFGTTVEFELIHSIMSDLKVPYLALIGNHDVLGTGQFLYAQMYGDDNFTFNVADVQFVCLNTNAMEYDEGSDVPNIEYITSEVSRAKSTSRTIVAMHAAPYSEQLPEDKAVMMHDEITKFDNLLFCVNAHGHNTRIEEYFGDGVTYYQCASTQNRSFFLFTITQTGYHYEEVFF